MYAYAASLKPEVERVVVVERAPEVIAVVREAAGLASWPGREKVIVLEADALGPDLPTRVGAATKGRRADYFYADIWPTCGAAEAPTETARMAQALRPEAAGWWGQELSFGLWCRESKREPSEASLRAYGDQIGVPIPISEGYASFCEDVIAARLPRSKVVPRSRGPSHGRWPSLSRLWRKVRSIGRP
jgi:hypothetical protein